MTALFLHILWSLLYIIITILYNIIIFLLRNNKDMISQYNSNYFIKILLILFYNKNFSFYSDIISTTEAKVIELERLKHYPTLTLIHSNLDKLEKKYKRKYSLRFFKKQYRLYKFINNNTNLASILENCNNKILFSTLLYIIYSNYNCFFKIHKNTDIIVYLLITRFSIINNIISVSKYDIYKFNDYIKYISNTNVNDIFLKNQIVFGLKNSSKSKIKKKLNIKLINSYFKYKDLFLINNNTFLLKELNSILNININNEFLINLKNVFKVSFSSSNIVKYLSDKSTNNSVILYLRKNKIFNKGRYSRNRQTYRTGAYWCLYINIIAVVAFYFWFYKFTMNFGYLWWLLYSLIFSFFFSRALKYRFYNPLNISYEFLGGFRWFILILINILKPLFFVIKANIINLYNQLIIRYYQSSICNLLIKKKKIEFNYVLSSFNLIEKFNNFLVLVIFKLI